MKRTKLRKKYKPSDLNPNDIDLLVRANYLDEREKEFLTFGNSYLKLRSLDLITDECQVSWYGKQFLKEMSN